MNYPKTYIILSFVLLLLCACQREVLSGEVSEAASLCLDLSVPGLRIESKGNADNPFADNISSWTDWDKVVDGRMMYRLTVFLIEKDTDYLVAYRDIYYSTYSGSDVTDPSAPQGPNGWYNGTSVDVNLSSSTQAQISFLFDNPLHTAIDGSSFERLQRGTYKLLAVANYSSVNGTKFNGQPDDVASYKGLGDGSFDTSVDGVIAEFKTAQNSGTKIKFANYTHYSSLVNYVLKSSSSSFICPAMPQPLTLAKEIELSPGMNTVSGELLRTFSRIRLSVENLSNVDLTVRSLSFSSNTTKDQTYLFSLPETPDRVYTIGTAGAPVVSSTDAIVPFTGSTVIDDLASGNNTKTLFDAYILESRGATGDYTYTLDLEYVGEAAIPQYEKTSTVISTVVGLTDRGNYLFQNQNNQYRFLIASSDYLQTVDVELADLPTTLDEAMVMKLIPFDSNGNALGTETINSVPYPKYIIQTQYGGTTYYLGTPGRSTNIPMVPNHSSATVFTVRDDWGGNLTFLSNTNNENGNRDFINVHGGLQDKVMGWNDNDGGSQFKLYAVNQQMKAPKYSDPIVLSTIDPVTSVVSPVNTIRRNDFINVLISVSYNKDLGDFEFEVKPWGEVSGSIEFN